MQQIVLIDLSNLAFRAYFSHKDKNRQSLMNREGYATGMLYGTIQSLYYLYQKYQWNYKQVILVQDSKPVNKFELYPEYKSGRKKEELPEKQSIGLQLKMTKMVLGYLGINQVVSDGNECDDAICTLCKLFTSNNFKVLVVSADHDMNQLLSPNVDIMALINQGEPIITEDLFVEQNSFVPDDYWKIQTLAGCSTDNVPGMTGIGEGMASHIITMNSWERIIKNDIELKFPDKRSQTAFRKNFEQWNWQRDMQLVKLKNNVKITHIKGKLDKDVVRKWFLRLEFKHFLLPDNFHNLLKVFGGY